MSITHITDHERELLARIDLLKLALLSIQARANSIQIVGLAYDVYQIAGKALGGDE